MTDKIERNDDESSLSKRIHRRSLLKAGAIAAPVALTLHSGAAATGLGNHASSAGLCALDLREIARNRSHPNSPYLQIPMKNGRLARRNDRQRHTPRVRLRDLEPGSRLEPFDPRNRVHWDFVQNPRNGRFGMSCINSIQYSQFNGRGRRRG